MPHKKGDGLTRRKIDREHQLKAKRQRKRERKLQRELAKRFKNFGGEAE